MAVIGTPKIRDEAEEKRPLRRLQAVLLATWRIPLVATLILALFVAAGFAMLPLLLPTTTTYISQFHFTFPGAESGRYPNALPFSINEILDPAILDVVYDQLELKQHGLERERFYGAFSIRPFAPTELELSERYRQQLLDRRLSFAERERVEQQMRNQIEQASRSAAELSFTLLQRSNFPTEVGRAVVQKVPRVWSQLAIEKKGVLRIAGFSATDNVISSQTIEHQSLPVGILALTEASQRLYDRLTELFKTPGALTVRDAKTSKSAKDLERDIRDLHLFHINPLRAALVTYRFNEGGTELYHIVDRRISDLEILVNDVASQAAAVGDSVIRYVQALAGLKGAAVERRGADSAIAGGGTTIPQVGEGFIDRIIELTRRSRDAEQAQAFISDRTTAQFELNRHAVSLRNEQSRWKDLLADLRADGASQRDLDEATRDKLIQQLLRAIEQANANWAALSRIEAEFAANRAGRTAEIYAPYMTERDVIRSTPFLNRIVLGQVIAALIVVFLLFWGLRAGLLLARQSGTSRLQE